GALPDARSDQYSFCVALYEALYRARPPATGRERGAPTRIRRILERGLRATPADRFPTMESLVDALERAPFAARWSVRTAAGVAALTGLGWRRHAVTEQHACDEAARLASSAWSRERAGGVHDAFARSGLSYAEPTFRSVERVLGRYVADWSRMRGEVCTDRI